MFKRLLVTLGILAGLLSPVHAAGTIPGISMTQQLDQYAKPLSGGLLYLIQAGTTSTPQNCYQDTALTLAWPNPITLDASGRVPQIFCADGNIKIRLTDKNGVQQLVQDNLLVVGPSSGEGGGGTVDPTTILATGDMKITYGTGTLSGFVRANGRTIGSATSGATERANADTQSLFEYLWGADANLVVSGGRGVSAAADWSANKTIVLPDLRGRAIAGMDTMGNSSADRLNPSVSGDLGSVGGSQTVTLARANLPNVAPTFTGSTGVVSVNSTSGNVAAGMFDSAAGAGINSKGVTSFGTITSTGVFTPVGTVSSLNGGVTQTAFQTLPPLMVMTIYIKL